MLDVRASPYDLSNASELLAGTESVFGDLSSVRIETLDGRQEYQRIQGEIAADAVPLRLRLLEAYESALEPLGATTGREGDGGGSSGARRSRRLRPTPALPPPADGWVLRGVMDGCRNGIMYSTSGGAHLRPSRRHGSPIACQVSLSHQLATCPTRVFFL